MKPLIIIGAGRSGTNALRDALVSMPEFSTWPCDEINYIWRSGNRDLPTDELKPGHARPEVTRFITRSFTRQAGKEPNTQLVEKTCANSLRVGFVDAVFPEARFVHIQRDGRDAVSSAMSRWTAPLDVRYLAKKVRFVPRRDLPHYGLRYLRSRLARGGSDDGRLSTWGPRFQGLDEIVANQPLDVVCAEQWAACVTSAREQLASLPTDRVLQIDYAGLAKDSAYTLETIAEFAERPVQRDFVARAASTIHSSSIGAWKNRLDEAAVERITPVIERVQGSTTS